MRELEWIVSGYALTFAALMLTGGKLADLFGAPADLRRRPRDLQRELARLRARALRRA
jgi:MFS family permease